MDPQEVLQAAMAALDRGDYSQEEVDAIVSQNTEYPNVFALRMAMESVADRQTADEILEMTGGEEAGRGRQALAAVQNFFGSGIQGATLGLADEAVGLVNPEAGANLREAQARRAEHAPAADVLSQIAGGLVIPGAVGAGASRQAPGILRSTLSGAARAGLTGAGAGAVAGAGFSEPGERLEGAKFGALGGGIGGAILGGPFGAVAGVIGSRAGRGGRVGQILQQLTNRERSMTEIRNTVRGDLDLVSTTLYAPLQNEVRAMSPSIESALFHISSDPATRSAVPRSLRPKSAGQLVGGEPIVAASAREARFKDLQRLRDRLRKASNGPGLEAAAAAEADDVLSRAMRETFGEPLTIADEAWHNVNAQSRGAEAGWKNWNKLSDDLTEAVGDLERSSSPGATPQAIEAFHEGRTARVVAELNRNNTRVPAVLKGWMDAGDETFAQLEGLFTDPADFQTFRDMLGRERRSAAVVDFFNSSIRQVGIGVVGGTAGASVAGLFSGGN